MTEIEEDFIDILKELEYRIEEPIKYNNKKASGLLRQLLLDDFPLLDQVNRIYRQKVLFKVRILESAPPGIANIIMEGIVPIEKESSEKHEMLNLKDFLKKRCLIYMEHIYTVQDIIKINANVRGGIHSGKAKSAKENQAIDMINNGPIITYKNGAPMDMTLGLVHDVARVVIDALSGIKSKIISSNI